MVRPSTNKKGYNSVKAQKVNNFSNKVFFIKVCTFLTQCYCTLNRLMYSVNVTFAHTGKQKMCDSLYCRVHFIAMVCNQSCNNSEVWLH